MKECLLHATAVAIDGNGVIMIGASGSGKSDLALRLIDRGAILVSDDVVRVIADSALPSLRAAPNIEGLLEVRGVGVVHFPYLENVTLRLVAALTDHTDRMPTEGAETAIAGFTVPLTKIRPFETSAPLKLEFALRSIVDANIWPVASTSKCLSESGMI